MYDDNNFLANGLRDCPCGSGIIPRLCDCKPEEEEGDEDE